MAYTDQQMSGNRITALVIVALIHIFLGYALVTGLAYSAVQQVIKKVTTVDIKKDEPKKPPPPPPPPKNAPPPPVAPPVRINVAVTPPQIVTVTTPPPPAPVIVLPPPPAAPPPPSRARSLGDVPNRKSWMAEIQDSASSELVRQGKSGSVGVSITVGPNGRPTGCSVTRSSNVPGLDALACSGIMHYARYSPALNDAGSPISSSRSENFRFDFSEQDN